MERVFSDVAKVRIRHLGGLADTVIVTLDFSGEVGARVSAAIIDGEGLSLSVGPATSSVEVWRA